MTYLKYRGYLIYSDCKGEVWNAGDELGFLFGPYDSAEATCDAIDGFIQANLDQAK